jgi:hypothetical protein
MRVAQIRGGKYAYSYACAAICRVDNGGDVVLITAMDANAGGGWVVVRVDMIDPHTIPNNLLKMSNNCDKIII